MQLAPLPKGLIKTASMTTTNLIAETDMIGVVPQSIADTYARHGLLRVLPRHIQHKMELFGYITRKNRPLSAATRFFSFSASPALNPVALLLIAVCGRQYCARSQFHENFVRRGAPGLASLLASALGVPFHVAREKPEKESTHTYHERYAHDGHDSVVSREKIGE